MINSIREIDFHSKILDLFNTNQDSVIVLHGGTKQGGKIESLNRFKTNFKRLTKSSQDRIVLENCETCYTIQDLLPVCKELNIPLVVDFHHHNINSGEIKNIHHLLEVIIDHVVPIWVKRNIKPKMHLSESRPNVVLTDNITTRRAHADYITFIPEIIYLLNKVGI